jgi:hypothetical protein
MPPRVASADGRLGRVPVRADGVIVQTLIALAMIAALGAVLRWTFGRNPSSAGTAEPAASGTAVEPRPAKGPVPPSADRRPAIDGPTTDGLTVDGATESRPIDGSTQPPPSDGPTQPPPFDGPVPAPATAETTVAEDFGLLSVVVTVKTAELADRMRARLRAAGIRATTSQGRDGRHRVLVFSSDLRRARRVAGSSG